MNLKVCKNCKRAKKASDEKHIYCPEFDKYFSPEKAETNFCYEGLWVVDQRLTVSDKESFNGEKKQ